MQQQQQQTSAVAPDKASTMQHDLRLKPNSHRLLNYTTFENNQYKFSLNNAFASKTNSQATNARTMGDTSVAAAKSNSMANSFASSANNSTAFDRVPQWSNSPAAPYYYQGPSSVAVHAKKRDAKSDLGMPTRRMSGQSGITKTQLLTGGVGGGIGYMSSATGSGLPGYGAGSITSTHYNPLGYSARLHPAKSDLFLAYPTTNEYEPPFIYNYKMPQMPEFLRNQQPQQQQQQQAQQQHQQPNQSHSTAYHISGSQTADPPPPNVYSTSKSGSSNSANAGYGGTQPATDVMYYQFDNSNATAGSGNNNTAAFQPIVQQPKKMGATANSPTHAGMGPLVFMQHQQQTNTTTAVTNMQQQQQQHQLLMQHQQQQQQHQSVSNSCKCFSRYVEVACILPVMFVFCVAPRFMLL